ncbi:MAG: branched-chain amino acid ABC transporter permease [Xanthobacteraceae bacterium]|nr:branched-chain amino acid ABC transporter permease [Xanthobacteraceae bacterium]GIK97754.1 MAG: branched-chain amino acid ABC transporter permease [Alphaproteobacteria bacterium]
MTLPGGIYSETYAQDRALIRSPGQWAWFVALMVGLVVLPIIVSGRIVGIANVIGVTLVAVIGLQLTSGFAGQINMGQSAFMGFGAYVCGALAAKFGTPFWITLPLAGIGAAAFGAFFGLAALRIKGFYLALTTIAAQYIFSFAMMKLPKEWFGRAEGLRLEPASLGGFAFDTDARMYYLILFVVILMTAGAFGIARSRTGRAFVAVRDNDNAAEVIGINVFYYKILAFFIGAFYAGVAGGLWAYYVRYVQADQFTLWLSVWYVGMLIVGGMGSVLGAIIGTVVIRLLQEFITTAGPVLSDWFPQIGGQIVFAGMNILLGGLIILFVIFEPRGLVHRWNIIKESYRIWPFPH